MPLKDINTIVPQDLVDNPELLTHKRGLWGQDSLTPFDGKVGAVIQGGEMFVTSPNMDVIYDPPLGKARVMQMRSDFRFGDDDPWQWPQPYSISLCHLAAIPRRPLDQNDPLTIMWWTPSREDFVPSTASSLIVGVGQLDIRRLHSLRQPIMDILDRFEKYKNDPHHPKTNVYATVSANHLRHGFARLETLATNRRSVFFDVTQVQRCFLELTAVLDYIYIYKPRMDGETSPASIVARTIGAFAFEAQVIQEFVRAGLPVWVVRNLNALAFTRIDKVKVVRHPKNFICVEKANPAFTPFFTGAATDPQKYMQLGLYIRSFIRYPNPFGYSPEVPQTSSSQNTSQSSHSLSSKSSVKKTRVQPYTKRAPPATSASHSGHNKFTSPSSPLLPPAIPIWQDALLEVDINPANLVHETRPSDSGYVFPDPGLFVGTSSIERQAKYIHHWLKFQTDLIFRLSSPQSSARPISNQLWRDLLTFGGTPPETSVAGAATKAATRRKQIIDMLGNCVAKDGVSISTSANPEEPSWRGHSVSATALPPQDICQEIFWELNELNFRFEFLALDSRAAVCVGPDDDRQDKVVACFGGNSFLVADVKESSQGIGAEGWKDRVPSLLAMASLMQGWVHVPPILATFTIKAAEDISAPETAILEQTVARFYTQSFFNFFARAAIVPRRLP